MSTTSNKSSQAVSDPRLDDPCRIAARVLRTEGQAVLQMAEQLPEGYAAAIELIQKAPGHVIVSGMGKSGHVARKIAATLASTGTPALFVHPAEASHGDLGMIREQDICVLLSNSGETSELKDIIAHCARFSIPLISICRKANSTLAQASDVSLVLPDAPEACAIGMAPTTSTTLSLALGDALAVTLMQLRGFERDNFLMFHPGGNLGAQLLRVGHLMHVGDELPIIPADALMGDALLVITAKGLGCGVIVEEGRLAGSITDGDLRRNLDGLMEKTAAQVAATDPYVISPDALASEALGMMNEYKITALFAVSDDGQVQGLIHIHDILRAGVA